MTMEFYYVQNCTLCTEQEWTTSCFVKSLGGDGSVARHPEYLVRLHVACQVTCGGMSCTTDTFLLSDLMPCEDHERLKKLTSLHLNCNLSSLKTTPFSCALPISLIKFLSCSCSVEPCTNVSLAIHVIPSRLLNAASSCFWNISWEKTRPNCRRAKRRYDRCRCVCRYDMMIKMMSICFVVPALH